MARGRMSLPVWREDYGRRRLRSLAEEMAGSPAEEPVRRTDHHPGTRPSGLPGA